MCWIFCPSFFVSVVAFDPHGEKGILPEPHVLVRARLRSHIENLVRMYGHLLGPHQIEETPDADYAVRLTPVPRASWALVMAAIAEGTTYPNFKRAAGVEETDKLHRYSTFLHEVWALGRQHLQYGHLNRPRPKPKKDLLK